MNYPLSDDVERVGDHEMNRHLFDLNCFYQKYYVMWEKTSEPLHHLQRSRNSSDQQISLREKKKTKKKEKEKTGKVRKVMKD